MACASVRGGAGRTDGACACVRVTRGSGRRAWLEKKQEQEQWRPADVGVRLGTRREDEPRKYGLVRDQGRDSRAIKCDAVCASAAMVGRQRAGGGGGLPVNNEEARLAAGDAAGVAGGGRGAAAVRRP